MGTAKVREGSPDINEKGSTSNRLAQEVIQERESQSRAYGPSAAAVRDEPAPLSPSDTSVSWLEGYEPSPIDYVLQGVLPRGVVGYVFAPGGTGKSFLLLQVATSLASGVCFGPFRPVRPHKVLMLCAEDPQVIVYNRIHDIVVNGGFSLRALKSNLHVSSVVGKSGAFLKSDARGNIQPSEWSDWMRETISLHEGLEVLIIDPLSRFFRLEENKNEHATVFVSYLESLAREFGLTILFSHHTAKIMKGVSPRESSGRGAQAFEDCARMVAGMSIPNKETAQNLGIPDRERSN